jgi:formyltetrahydrofolate deformylase
MSAQTVRLLVTCRDGRGIVAAVTGFIAQYEGNILDLDQHTDPDHGEFFMRVELQLAGFGLERASFEAAWAPIARRYGMSWRVYWGDQPKRMAILVSKAGHCLNDLLYRWKSGELDVELPLVISNHRVLEDSVTANGVGFHYLPVSAEGKAEQEAAIIALLDAHHVDVVILARYMQILSPEFVARYPERIINIHHSFLPAFVGSKPYHQAYDRGVKIIGATSHFVTADLDQGPIIAQRTQCVDHRDSVSDLIRKGRDLERVVLAEAVRMHAEDKILVSQNKTVVFA